MARLVASLLLLLSFSALAAQEEETCALDGTCGDEGVPVKGSALLSRKHQKMLTKAVEEEGAGEDSDQMFEDMEAEYSGAHQEIEAELEAPEEAGDKVVSFVQSGEAANLNAQTKMNPFVGHWISMVDKGTFRSQGKSEVTKTVDGKKGTFGGGVVWEVDLGDVYSIERIEIDWRVCKCLDEDALHMDVSMVGMDWHTFAKPKVYAWGTDVKGVYGVAAHGRYIRIYTTKVSPVQYVAMWEIKMYGKMDPRRSNIYGWYSSYVAGNNMGMGGTEIMHLTSHQGTLFGGTGYWMSSGDFRAAEVVRLDCPFCDWFIDGVPSYYAGRVEVLKSIQWTTDTHGRRLASPVNKIYGTFYIQWQGKGTCGMAGRNDATRAWSTQTYWEKGPWQTNYFSARAMALHSDTVTGKDVLLVSTGMDGIVGGLYDPSQSISVKFPDSTESGPTATRPLSICVHDGKAYFSASSWIKRRTDGNHPSWHTVFDMGDVDDQTVDEAVGGIRGLSGIGSSMLFSWVPNSNSAGCMYRLDKSGNGFSHHAESCVRQVAADFLGKNHLGQPALTTFVISAYNDILDIPDKDGHGAKQIIGYEVLLYSYSAHQFPVAPQIATTAGGKRIAYYAGAGYMIRHSATHYEGREVFERRYDPSYMYPALVAVRAYALSPFGDNDIYMGGYDCNHYQSKNNAWAMKGTRSGAYAAAVPCQKELGCGHLPGTQFHTQGCDLCKGREFNGYEVGYFNSAGNPVTCQAVLNWLNLKAPADKCSKLQENPKFGRACCGGCNFCLGTGKVYDSTAVAGKAASGTTYTCETALNYVMTGQTTCHTATTWWKNACCKAVA